MGFGAQTFKELKAKKLLSKPAVLPLLHRQSPDRVYTLTTAALSTIVLIAVVNVVRETFQEVGQ